MDIKNRVALVTGANRGLGKAYAEALLAAGAAKVYAGARSASTISDPRLTPIKLDVTSARDIAAAAVICSDVDIIVNNAGVMLMSPILAKDSETAMRREMEVNVYGVLGMARAFAPILAANGGGAIANVLSVASWFVVPLHATYCASKYAALAVTDALRIQLKAQGTLVVGVYAGYMDTDMSAELDSPKTQPRQVAERTLDGIRQGAEYVCADTRARDVWQILRIDPGRLADQMQALWDQRIHSSLASFTGR